MKKQDAQLKKLKTAATNMTRTTIRITNKNFQEEELPHELFLTRKKTKTRNAFPKNISKDINLSKAQISK